MKDWNSKFGTVTRLWHPISIPNKKNHSVEFQVGRSYVQLTTGGLLKSSKKKLKYFYITNFISQVSSIIDESQIENKVGENITTEVTIWKII